MNEEPSKPENYSEDKALEIDLNRHEGIVSVHTKDGKVHSGHVLGTTCGWVSLSLGSLLATVRLSEVVAYSTVEQGGK